MTEALTLVGLGLVNFVEWLFVALVAYPIGFIIVAGILYLLRRRNARHGLKRRNSRTVFAEPFTGNSFLQQQQFQQQSQQHLQQHHMYAQQQQQLLHQQQLMQQQGQQQPQLLQQQQQQQSQQQQLLQQQQQQQSSSQSQQPLIVDDSVASYAAAKQGHRRHRSLGMGTGVVPSAAIPPVPAGPRIGADMTRTLSVSKMA